MIETDFQSKICNTNISKIAHIKINDVDEILDLRSAATKQLFFAPINLHSIVSRMRSITTTILLFVWVPIVADAFIVRSTLPPRNKAPKLNEGSKVILAYQQLEEESNQIYYRAPLTEDERKREELTNAVLNASRSSFQNVEGKAFNLLEENPLLAFLIFVALGLVVAYISGFIFLGGYISSANPVENGAIPYWDEQLPVDID